MRLKIYLAQPTGFAAGSLSAVQPLSRHSRVHAWSSRYIFLARFRGILEGGCA